MPLGNTPAPETVEVNEKAKAPVENSGGDAKGKEEKAAKPETFTLTSEQIGARADRAKGTALKDLYKELGVENAEDLKKIIAKKQELEAATLTDKEKVEKELKEARAREATLQAKLDEQEKDRKVEEREASFKKAAIKAGVNEDDLDVVLPKLELYIKKTLEGASPTKDDLVAFFEDLKTKKPVLFKATKEAANTTKANTGSPKPGAAGGSPGKGRTLEEVFAMPKAEFQAELKRR